MLHFLHNIEHYMMLEVPCPWEISRALMTRVESDQNPNEMLSYALDHPGSIL